MAPGFQRQIYFLPFVFLFLAQFANLANGTYFTEVETLSKAHKDTLAKFKATMLPILPHDYMKEDIYLVKFLQINNFKFQKAEEQLKETLKWREENNVEEAGHQRPEYLLNLEKDYPTFMSGEDKEGRPICEVPFGAWPIRKGGVSGVIKQLITHLLVSCAERASVRIREKQAQGQNVTQFIFLGNMEGFSIAEHVCPSCLPLHLGMVVGHDKYYPLMSHGTWLINTPETFAQLFRLIRPGMSPATRNSLKVFDTNEAEWRQFLEKRIDFNEISDWFPGGTRERTAQN